MNNANKTLMNLGILWLRILIGIGIAIHGYGKLFGGDITAFAGMVEKLGFPMPLLFAYLSALAEFGGGICLALGLGTRFAAFFVFFNMSVAAFRFHSQDPLKVKELALAYWAGAGALLLTGGGLFSIDHFIWKPIKKLIGLDK